MLSRLFSKRRAETKAAPSTGGRLVYAIGDIHGRLDLLASLLNLISEDAHRDEAPDLPALVFLGDYVDRGPHSKGVLDLVRATLRASNFEVRALMGNHEQVMLQFLDDSSVGPSWVEYGGGATLSSYGLQPPGGRATPEAWEATRLEFVATLPDEDRTLLQMLELSVTYGDYFFVHAGVRPDAPLDRQEAADLLWIRNEFLDHPHRLEKVIVHGHTPEVEPYLGDARIGVDTGAYATGVLTAAKLYGEARSVLQARPTR